MVILLFVARLGVPNTRSLYFVNATRAINLDGTAEDEIDDIAKIDIMLD